MCVCVCVCFTVYLCCVCVFHCVPLLCVCFSFSGDRVDGHMDALLSSLRVLGNLQQVKLHINCLSETWATWTLSLIEACPSLEKIM